MDMEGPPIVRSLVNLTRDVPIGKREVKL